jgi:V8-like Glu-specific endopeptidase
VCSFAISGCTVLRSALFSPDKAPSPELASLPDADPERSSFEPPPVALSEPEDFVVRVVAGNVSCTGTLIEEDRVLTAHHCVAARQRDGSFKQADVKPADIRIELGGDDLPWGEVLVRAIVAPTCGYDGGEGDIAILVLDRRLTGITTQPASIDHEPSIGESIGLLGFGRCALSTGGIRRHVRQGGRIDVLNHERFQLDAALCPGDSGGPALTPKGELVGVTSAGIMDGSAQTLDRTEFTRIDAWRSVFGTAELVSQGASLAELPPVDCPR